MMKLKRSLVMWALILLVASVPVAFGIVAASPSTTSSKLISSLEEGDVEYVILDIHQGLGIYYPIKPSYTILENGAIECDVIVDPQGGIKHKVFTDWVEIR